MIGFIMGQLLAQTQKTSIIQGAQSGFFGAGVPTYFIQPVIGLYVGQIVIVLTILVNAINNGGDKLTEEHLLGKNMFKVGAMYAAIAFIVMLLFNVIAGKVLAQKLGAL